jgi:hypothetical protein
MGHALFGETVPDSKERVKEASSSERYPADIVIDDDMRS